MHRRKFFVTTALPYANGPLHIGHIMEYIQADIWVRFQRMQGHEMHFMGAEDAHGAPNMLAAEKAGKSPEAFVTEIAGGRKQYLDGFHLSFDNWHSTHSPENTALSQDIYRKLKAAGLDHIQLSFQDSTRELNDFLSHTRTFDLNPVCTLEVGYHLFCENYKRGEFLANLRATEAPFELGQEFQLPDYLPVLAHRQRSAFHVTGVEVPVGVQPSSARGRTLTAWRKSSGIEGRFCA